MPSLPLTFAQCCRELQLDAAAARLLEPHFISEAPNWPGTTFFLDDAFIQRYYPRLQAAVIPLDTLLQTAALARQSPAVQLYAWLLYRCFYVTFTPGSLNQMPDLTGIFGVHAGGFHLLVALAAFPLVEAGMAKAGLPLHYSNYVGNWFYETNLNYAAAHGGNNGYPARQFGWVANFIKARVLRIGRFEYELHDLPEWVPAVYRRKSDRKLLFLCREGWHFDAEGLRAHPDQGILRTSLRFADNSVTGTPINPHGIPDLQQTTTISLDDFEEAVSAWEMVPSIHIPAGGGMTPDAALQSLREARTVFKTCLGRDLRAFVCMSWILSPDWERELPDSNLAKFRQLGYLTPGLPPSGLDGLYFIFGCSGTPDWNQLPADNSIRRAFHRVHADGRPLRNGAIFFACEDLDLLEPGYYRSGIRSL